MAKRQKQTVSIRDFPKYSQRAVKREAPMYRYQCARIERPCPFVGCVHSMFLRITDSGSIVFLFGTQEPWRMPAEQSCVLDIIEAKKHLTLEEIGDIWGLSRERIRQIEETALDKLKRERIEWER